MIDDMLGALVRSASHPSDAREVTAAELENLRIFTKAYQAVLDTNAASTISVGYDFPAWIQESFGCDLAEFQVDGRMSLTLRRARGRLPNARLESVDASTCSQQQFTEWLYFIRNTRDYVAIEATESEAA